MQGARRSWNTVKNRVMLWLEYLATESKYDWLPDGWSIHRSYTGYYGEKDCIKRIIIESPALIVKRVVIDPYNYRVEFWNRDQKFGEISLQGYLDYVDYRVKPVIERWLDELEKAAESAGIVLPSDEKHAAYESALKETLETWGVSCVNS